MPRWKMTLSESSPLEEQQQDFTETFGRAYIQVYASLVQGPEHVVDWWTDGVIPELKIPMLAQQLTPEGIREIARSLASVADVMEDRGRSEFR